MGRELYDKEPVFAARVRECDEAFRRVSGASILEQLSVREVKSQVRRVDIGQAMLLAVHLGLAALWEDWGVVPQAVVGHAAGELSAACYAGAVTIDDAVRVIVARAAVMRRLAGTGLMVAVKADEATGAALIRGLEDQIAVGVVNGPQSIVLSGEGDAMIGLAHQLASKGIQHRVLHLPYAVYAPRMAAAAPELARTLGDLAPTASRIPIVSTVTGDVIDGAQLDAAHWARNIADPVRFADALATLFARGADLFVEIGPHPTLGRPIEECAAAAGRAVTVLPSLLRGKPEQATMRKALAALREVLEGKPQGKRDAKAEKKVEAKGDKIPTRLAIAARIVPISPPSAFPATYFVGGAGGSDAPYLREVAAALGPSHRSFALTYSASGAGDAATADIEQLAATLAEQVAANSPDEPVALVGHAKGGAIAYETARLLERRGVKVTALVLIDAPSNLGRDAASAWTRLDLSTARAPHAADVARAIQGLFSACHGGRTGYGSSDVT